MLQADIEAEVRTYIDAHRDERDEEGHRLDLRNGRQPERQVQTGEIFSPKSYRAMRELTAPNQQLQDAALLGLSQGDYERVASTMTECIGLSQSSVSQYFYKRGAKTLEEFKNCPLGGNDFVALWIDAKCLADQAAVPESYRKGAWLRGGPTVHHRPNQGPLSRRFSAKFALFPSGGVS